MALNRVQVVVVGALDLPAMDGKTSDPYVKFQYKGKEYRTDTVKKTLQPTWNYTAEITYNKLFGPHLLYLEVWDAHMIRSDKLIGKATLNLESLELNKAVDKWYALEHAAKAQDSATLRVKLTLLPPLSESNPNAGGAQKVVVTPHGSAQAFARTPPVCWTPPVARPYPSTPPVSPPSVYPVYTASLSPAVYTPPTSPPATYGYSVAAPPPVAPAAPVVQIHPPHPPPFGYPATPTVPSAPPPPMYGAGIPYVYPAPPQDGRSNPCASSCPFQQGKAYKKGRKKKGGKESTSSSCDSESSSGGSSTGEVSKKKGKKSHSKPQAIKMEIKLPSV